MTLIPGFKEGLSQMKEGGKAVFVIPADKGYGADGCQITTEAAAEILAEIEKLDIFADVKTSDFEAGVANGSIVCYDIKELGKQMKKLGMLIVQDQVWGRVTANRSSGKSTRYYM